MNVKQKAHLMNYLSEDTRYDGRKKGEVRPITVKYDVSKTAEGSAEVWMGNTHVIAGVKMEVNTPYPDRQDEGGLMVNAELYPMSSEDYESGPPTIKAIELARVIDRGIRESKSIDGKKLCIEVGEKVWTVIVDVCTINDDGNALDACGLAALAALQDAKFPEYDKKTGTLDYKKKTKKGLPLSKNPVPVTVYKIGEHLVVDPLPDEEKAAEARLTITVTDKGEMCSLQKGGDTPLTTTEVDSMVALALDAAKKMRKAL